MPFLDAHAAAEQGVAESDKHEIAVLFGRERYGLTNDEMQRCNYLVNIQTNPEYGSLNIAQAVQIIAYEFRLAAIRQAGGEVGVVLTHRVTTDAAQFPEELPAAHRGISHCRPVAPKIPAVES